MSGRVLLSLIRLIAPPQPPPLRQPPSAARRGISPIQRPNLLMVGIDRLRHALANPSSARRAARRWCCCSSLAASTSAALLSRPWLFPKPDAEVSDQASTLDHRGRP